MTWPTGVCLTLTSVRDGREGIRGELTVTDDGRRVSWGTVALSSTAARETLRKKLVATTPSLPWGDYLEEAAWRFTQAARAGEPFVTLTGAPASPTRELLPRLLYEGEPTQIYGDGENGKSLTAAALAVGVQSGASLPCGLKPTRPVPVAVLDWETSRDTWEHRVGLVSAGLGVDPPGIIYKRMTRPLVGEVNELAAEFARRGIGLVIVDSLMFALAGGEGALFHEPITAVYNALRLFAPAASLVLNHVTNADARHGGKTRPYGGAFAHNGPRLSWEVKRDRDAIDGTAVAFTCHKANNLPRLPEPFGLLFKPGDGAITIYPYDLNDAAPGVVAGAGLPYRIRLVLAEGALTVAEIAEKIGADEENVGRVLRRLRDRDIVRQVGNTRPYRWELIR